ncbi:DNA-formamidopyrimidine glycosylase family protein [Streptomyces sp. 4N509B]|uniref:DNA-formamidopyrimidine glycosylase family protein n=1 Tax=Streptomyces sp. 4N509B TaxID=3457413 RepID=UPI003FD146AC
MPEGDTVWQAARRLHQALAGHTVVRSDLRVPRLATVDLTGRAVLEVVPRGKHLLMRLGGGLTLHSHLRMEGAWRVYGPRERFSGGPGHQIRAILAVDPAADPAADPGGPSVGRPGRAGPPGDPPGNPPGGPPGSAPPSAAAGRRTAVGYRLQVLELLRTRDEARVVGHLGPDLLGPDWDAAEALRRLLADPARAVGAALLDQRVLAGIGNVYMAEVCFLAGVTPWLPVGEVPGPERLVALAGRLLEANRERPMRTTTIEPATGATGAAGRRAGAAAGPVPRGPRAPRLYVYGRADRPCLVCGDAVRVVNDRLSVGAARDPGRDRPTYWCATCQAGPGPRPC